MNEPTPGWSWMQLQDISDEIVGGGTPSRAIAPFWDGGVPWVTPGELTALKGKYLTRTAETISELGLANSGARLLPIETLMVTTRATIGLRALTAMPTATNQGFKSLIFSQQASPDFYYHVLGTTIREMVRRASGTTFLEISSKEFARITVPHPPMPEQRRIAEILDTLDERIRRAEQLIAKSLLYRAGLISDLINQCPRRSRLEAALVGAPGNGIYKPASMIGRGTLLVGQTAFTPDGLVDTSVARRAVVTHTELERFGLRDGDILVSRVFATLEGVGQPAWVRSLPEAAVYESNMMRLRPDTRCADSYFLFLTLQTRSAREWIVQHANLSNQASIAQTVLTSMPVWLPEISEQRRVGAILSAEAEKREVGARELRKLMLMKEGLGADLIYGRVRVPVEAAQ
jgi:type I restriction enzyme, S subunit